MAGPNIEGSRVSDADVQRLIACQKCGKSTGAMVCMILFDDPAYWCLACLADQLKREA